MPVTAKLSRHFYERLGEQVANELVDWFNAVDDTYRQDLRSLNEINFARFDAKVDQRFAEQDAKWEQRFAQQDAKWEQRFAELELRWNARLTALEVNWERRFAQLDAKIDRSAADLLSHVDRRLQEQTRWLFLAWASLGVGVVGLWIRG